MPVHVVRYAVARRGKQHPELGSTALEVPVVVGIFEIGLKNVVIYVAY